MTNYHVSDVAFEIEQGDKLADLQAIYWACREAEGVASLMSQSLDRLIEDSEADMWIIERMRDVEQAASLIRRRMQAVTCGVEHAESKIRTALKEERPSAAELARVAEAMQAAEGAGRRGKR